MTNKSLTPGALFSAGGVLYAYIGLSPDHGRERERAPAAFPPEHWCYLRVFCTTTAKFWNLPFWRDGIKWL